MKYVAGVFLASSIVVGSPALAAAPDPEATLELEFTVWANDNNVVIHRLSCDVTTGEGDLCFVLTGPDVAAYIPAADGVTWTLYGGPIAAAPAGTSPQTTTVPPIQPLVSDTSVYYAN